MRSLFAAAMAAILLFTTPAQAGGPADETRSGRNVVVDIATGDCYELTQIACPDESTPVTPADLSIPPIPLAEVVVTPVKPAAPKASTPEPAPEATLEPATVSKPEATREPEANQKAEPEATPEPASPIIISPWYMTVGISGGLFKGSSIDGVEDVSQGVGEWRRDLGVALGLGWESKRGGALLLVRGAKRSDVGLSGDAVLIRFTNIGEAWSVGIGAGVAGASYEVLDAAHPGSIEYGVVGELYLRYALALDAGRGGRAPLDVVLRPAAVGCHQVNPLGGKLGWQVGGSIELLTRF